MTNKNQNNISSNDEMKDIPFLGRRTVVYMILFSVAIRILIEAYRIRLIAIRDFGLVIHEFDPYFNLRATEVSKHFFLSVFENLVWMNEKMSIKGLDSIANESNTISHTLSCTISLVSL